MRINKLNVSFQRPLVSGWVVALANPLAVKQLLFKPGTIYGKHAFR